LVAEVDEFVAAAECGYFILEAAAGLGKTAFAAFLAQSGRHACHFTAMDSGAAEVSVAVRNLSAQLIAAWHLDELLDDGRLPPASGRSMWLAKVLTAVARRRDRDRPGQPVLLVVDGLDEARPAGPDRMPLGLPPRGREWRCQSPCRSVSGD
jgi:hypothetical protein